MFDNSHADVIVSATIGRQPRLFALNWNSFLIPMVVTTHHVRTIPLAMSDFFVSDRELEWPTAAAALVISLAPLVALVAFPVAHRTLERFFLGTRQAGQ